MPRPIVFTLSACLKILSSSCWRPLAFLCNRQQKWLSPPSPALCVHADPCSLWMQRETQVSTGTWYLPFQLEQLTKVLSFMWTKSITDTVHAITTNVSAMSQLRDRCIPARWDTPLGTLVWHHVNAIEISGTLIFPSGGHCTHQCPVWVL